MAVVGRRDAAGRTLILIRCSNPAWTADNETHLADLLRYCFSSSLSFSYVSLFVVFVSKGEIMIRSASGQKKHSLSKKVTTSPLLSVPQLEKELLII